MTNERRRKERWQRHTYTNKIQSRVHTHTHTLAYEVVHSAWKRHRLMRENTHRPLNQNRAKVKHILGLSLACVWKFNKATATSVRVFVCLYLSACHESWPKDLAGFGWCCDQRGVCVIYTSANVCVCGRKFIASEQPKSEKHCKAWENTAHTHKHVRLMLL